MANSQALLVALLTVIAVLGQNPANFHRSTTFNWGANHSSISNNGDELQLALDRTSGSGIQSKKQFVFGSIEMPIKLVPGNSAGTVTAYYLSSRGSAHDEIDFEFLGNVSGQPYIVHTNIYTGGSGNREQQFYLWFNPTADFHNYTIHWNPNQIVNFFVLKSSASDSLTVTNFRDSKIFKKIPTPQEGLVPQIFLGIISCEINDSIIFLAPDNHVHGQCRWFIDGLPIRVFLNNEKMGILYPNKQAMNVYSSIWNADNWATRGGLVKIDWNSAPFVARFRRFRPRACKWTGPTSITQCALTTLVNWWTSPAFSKLSYSQMGQMKWVRDNYMIYDYCKDTRRFNGQMPPECAEQLF